MSMGATQDMDHRTIPCRAGRWFGPLIRGRRDLVPNADRHRGIIRRAGELMVALRVARRLPTAAGECSIPIWFLQSEMPEMQIADGAFDCQIRGVAGRRFVLRDRRIAR